MAFDLDAFIADQLAEGEPFVFTFGGEEYTLPSQPDPRTAAMFDVGMYDEAFRFMLGDDQYRRFLTSKTPLTKEGFLEVLRRHARHAGASVGESLASSDSSGNTGKPSRPTSNGSTKSVLRT